MTKNFSKIMLKKKFKIDIIKPNLKPKHLKRFQSYYTLSTLAVPGLGAGVGGALFGGVGIFWGTVAGIASMGAGIIVSA